MSLRSRLWQGTRLFGLWVLPPLLMVMLLALGFVWWSVASTSGTRWLLRTAVAQVGGQVHGVRGSLFDGLYVEGVNITQPDLELRVLGLHFKTAWPDLLRRRLHVNDLSAVRVDAVVRTETGDAGRSQGDFVMPALPLDVRIDRLALGGLGLEIDGEPLPLDLVSLSSSLSLDAQTASISLDQLQAMHGETLLEVQGFLALRGLAAPWPFELNLGGSAEGNLGQSPVCLRQLLQTGDATPVAAAQASADIVQAPAAGGQAGAGQHAVVAGQEHDCRIELDLHLAGDLQELQLRASGRGEGMLLQAGAQVFPERVFPLGSAHLDLDLPGRTRVEMSVEPGQPAADGLRPVHVQWLLQQLPLEPWLPAGLGSSMLDLAGRLDMRLTPALQLQDLGLDLAINAGSRWNAQPLAGSIRMARMGRIGGALLDPEQGGLPDPLSLDIQGLELALDLGPNHVRADGHAAMQDGRLALQADLPALAAFWPGLTGAADMKLAANGAAQQHQADLQLRYLPADAGAGTLGEAPLDAGLSVAGGWSQGHGWEGDLSQLQVQHAGLRIQGKTPLGAYVGPEGQWQLGAAALDVFLQDEHLLELNHQSSGGQGAHWASKGGIDELLISPARIKLLQDWLGIVLDGQGQDSSTTLVVSSAARESGHELLARAAWDLAFEDALGGKISLERTAGDITVPGDIPVTLGLESVRLDITAERLQAGLSRLAADLQLQTSAMGTLRVQANTPLHATPSGGLLVRPADEKHVHVQAESENLAWVNLFLDGSVEIGGTVHADIRGRSRPDGRWLFSGPLTAEGLRILILDQGVRLHQGTMQARFDGEHILLERLQFPAVRRVTPKEWRTATWISEEPDAQNGALTLAGIWDLVREEGRMGVNFYRYPILQRADRYAMASGSLQIQASLPEILVAGGLTADAGWFDVDMLNNIPALEGDVVILQPGETVQEDAGVPLDLKADVVLDLGPRFYLTGFGLNAGLVGNIDLRVRQGGLSALGSFRTRGGAIDAYGQHLQIRRGFVTFQGDISNPVLDIQALRTDVAVQAGVKVSGTARRPRIELMSQPDVSETEKLTWLLLGHGPDEGGGDMSLLFTVGGAFLADGEPFYKRFGLDELSMRSGEVGRVGSILPVQSVVSGLDAGASPIEERFVLAGKTISSDLKLSLEQALARTGTVARLSYRLMRRVRAELSVGTTSGLALVYRWFSMD